MTLRSGGLISGLDTNALISQLVQLERAPIQKLESKKSAYNSQLSLLGGIKSALSELKTKMKELDTASELVSMAATSSLETAVTADATGDAAAADYTVEVVQVARAEKDRSQGFSAIDAEVTAGTFTLTVKGGDAQNVTIEEGDTLQDVVAKINDEVVGATASIISDGTNYYLSLTADETGHTVGGAASDAIVISESYSGGAGQQLTMAEIQAAENALVTLDGLNVESDTNDIQSALTGVTLHVHEVTTSQETLTIQPDKSELEAKLQEFADAYNKIIELVLKETKVTAKTNRQATLAGDSSIRNLRAAMSSAVGFPIPSLAGNDYDALSTFGIKTDALGKLSIDSEDLQAALDDDLRSVTKVFTADDGLATRLLDLVGNYIDSDGILQARTDGLNRSIKAIDSRIFNMELRVQSYEINLVRQFTTLESTVSSLQTQGNFLASAL